MIAGAPNPDGTRSVPTPPPNFGSGRSSRAEGPAGGRYAAGRRRFARRDAGYGRQVSRAGVSSATADATRTSPFGLAGRCAARETRFHPEETPTHSLCVVPGFLHASNGGLWPPFSGTHARSRTRAAPRFRRWSRGPPDDRERAADRRPPAPRTRRTQTGETRRVRRDGDGLPDERTPARERHGHGRVVLDAGAAHREPPAARNRAHRQHRTPCGGAEDERLELGACGHVGYLRRQTMAARTRTPVSGNPTGLDYHRGILADPGR